MTICRKCGNEYEKRCASCHASYMKQWRKDNREKAREIGRRGYRKWCDANPEEKRRQARESAAKRKKENPDGQKRARRKHTFKKLGLDEVDIRSCPKCCECCGGPPIEGKRLCIDHAHDTKNSEDGYATTAIQV